MINAYQVLKGYQNILGSIFLQLPLFVVTLVYVTVPKDIEYYVDVHAQKLVAT